MPDTETIAAQTADTPAEPEISVETTVAPEAAETTPVVDAGTEAFKWGEGTDDPAEAEPETPATAKSEGKEKAKTQPEKAEEPELPDEFAVGEDDADITDPAVKAKVDEANKGITRKFAKLDAAYKAKEQAVVEREKAVAEREAIADETEALFLQTLSGEADLKSVDILKWLDKHPKAKEFKSVLQQQQQYIEQLENHVTANEVLTAMRGLGWADTETQKFFANNPDRLAKVKKYIEAGEPLADILPLVGVRDKRKSFNMPRPDGAAATGSKASPFVWTG